MLKPAAAALAVLLCATASAREVAGVNVPDTLELAGKKLQLNGAGLRKKSFAFVPVKVYVGALYLEAPSSDAAAVVAADAPKAVRMVFMRSVTRSQFVDTLRDGFEANSPKEQVPSLLEKLKLIEPVVAALKEGSVLLLTYVPGAGTTLALEKGPSATVEGKEFADALFRNWLGKEPVQESLKEALLGKGE
jgi:hypothetical protein